MDDSGSEDTNESGGALRKQLEKALAANKELSKRVAAQEAKTLIESKGYKYVKPEALADVDLDEMADKAEALEKSGLETSKVLLRQVLTNQGVSADDLDSEVDRFLNPQESHAQTSSRVAEVGRTQGSYVAPRTEQTPMDLILAGVKD